MSRATRSRPTSTPSLRSCSHAFRAPYTEKFSVWTRAISTLSTSSRRALADAGRRLAA